MAKSRIINALYAKAIADKEKALLALDLLENAGVGIGDHTAEDFYKDGEKALELLCSANDRIETPELYYKAREEDLET